MKTSYRNNESRAQLEIRVIPQSSRSRIVKEDSGHLKAYLHAPPVDGRANGECIHLISKTFGIPKTSITIAGGEKNRNKVFVLSGASQERIDAVIDGL
ncbi:MAG: DUF167 domain-containing protein [Spirochaetota bacterium]